ncbi:MAG: recombinase family protein [Eubacterium sp.]|nr:recombinase family protein [Eubacterium sp.]
MEFNPKVNVIPTFKNSLGVKKVGIYARVSTARVEQLRSLAAQVSALSQYVYQRNDMIIRDIYMDVGSAKIGSSRREFSRLLEDCQNRKVNYVVTKSMSRFGRDTVESVESIRLLQEAGVTIFFMLEDKEVTKDTPEFDLSVRAAIMQSENEHRSENIKIGLRQKAELGTSGLYSKPCYGCVKDENGSLVPKVYQATVVQHIFQLYLEGKSEAAIIEDLAERKIPTVRGKERWSKKAIETILTKPSIFDLLQTHPFTPCFSGGG